MTYTICLISPEEKDRLTQCCMPRVRFEIKSDIYGCCIKLLSDNHTLKDTWQENFYAMSEGIRSHGRLFVFSDPLYPENSLLLDPYSKTAFLFNFSYYGWIKSIALGLTGDILEDEHGISSIHGACVDIGGRGLCIVGTSGAGKTTQTYGLLNNPYSRVISDDWFFSRVYGPDILAYGSEKNFYIREDLAGIWKEFDGLVGKDEYDADGRAVANLRWVVGKGRQLPFTTLKTLIILKRDPADPCTSRNLDPEEGLVLFTKNRYFNPHLLVDNQRKSNIRKRCITDLLERTCAYLVNTTGTPRETQSLIRSLVGLQE
ncbi:aldolase [uncultured Methanoregula sp.]|uniref:aldolase n=1 Tax=uncultured Methanoregula sp. TaxID=1005933 RepID=UPI002AAB2A2A|nr:aldolase [uncultured Methanoregula sp.]